MVVLSSWTDTTTGISPTIHRQYGCQNQDCQKIAAKEKATWEAKVEKKQRLDAQRKARLSGTAIK